VWLCGGVLMRVVKGKLEICHNRNKREILWFICECGVKSTHGASMETVILFEGSVAEKTFLMTTRMSHCNCGEDTLIVVPLNNESEFQELMEVLG
tara:strand:+ start:6257 stop:6541 length:285 start_codon:yes stop_codon:yes gene_type:complete